MTRPASPHVYRINRRREEVNCLSISNKKSPRINHIWGGGVEKGKNADVNGDRVVRWSRGRYYTWLRYHGTGRLSEEVDICIIRWAMRTACGPSSCSMNGAGVRVCVCASAAAAGAGSVCSSPAGSMSMCESMDMVVGLGGRLSVPPQNKMVSGGLLPSLFFRGLQNNS